MRRRTRSPGFTPGVVLSALPLRLTVGAALLAAYVPASPAHAVPAPLTPVRAPYAVTVQVAAPPTSAVRPTRKLSRAELHRRAHGLHVRLHQQYRAASSAKARARLAAQLRTVHTRLRTDHAQGISVTNSRVLSPTKRVVKRVVKRSTVHRHARKAVRRTESRRASRSYTRRPARGMAAVVAYAKAQVGKRYVFGATGPRSFDCSGLTMQAYKRAGINLPHQSGAQAARARKISRSQARPGDLVVGNGHVGVLTGKRNGRLWMVDAGNPRVGVAHRPVYRGLWIERLG